MTAHPIPLAALDDRLGFVGTAGSGKTYNAGSAIERVLGSGGRVVIPDPLGVWWGLGLCADGSSPAPWREKGQLVIFGGPHGDLPLNEHAGALIGETVAGMAESAILDLSGFGAKAAETRFMLAFLTTLYRHANNEPVHLVFDEADMWAPQQEREKGEGPKLLGMMETVVRRGRIRGFIPWLISQRPAVLNKNVLSQVDGLVAFKLTSSQDRAALGAWIEGQADRAQGKEILGALPTLPTGTGVVWLPNRDVLETAAFPQKVTFDSSRTPTRGERVERRELKPLDLDKLKGRLSSIEEEAKANDPRLLKSEVARLSRELAAAKKQAPAASPSWPDQREQVRQLTEELAATSTAMEQLTAGANELQRRQKLAVAALGGESVAIPAGAPPQRRIAQAPAPVQHHPSPARETPQSDANGAVPSGCNKPLAALAGAYPGGMTESQWSMVAGYKKTGGTWLEYRRRLVRAEMIERRGGLWYATELGAQAAGDVELPPPPGPELARWWAPKINAPMRVMDELIAAWPAGLDRTELAERIGMTATGGSFLEYVRRLIRNSIAEDSGGEVRLSDEVMGA